MTALWPKRASRYAVIVFWVILVFPLLGGERTMPIWAAMLFAPICAVWGEMLVLWRADYFGDGGE